jgi:hypothetical protein
MEHVDATIFRLAIFVLAIFVGLTVEGGALALDLGEEISTEAAVTQGGQVMQT